MARKKRNQPSEAKPPVQEQQDEAPRSRYEDDEAIDSEDQSIYLPPQINFKSMDEAQIAATSMRYLGRRPPPTATTKEQQVAYVQRELRAGLPGYARGR